MTFRIFENDRPSKNGVRMYSAFCEIAGVRDAATAERRAQAKYKGIGRVKAIEWPPALAESKRWLAKHVGL